MSKTTNTFTLRVSADLKAAFDAFCDERGLSSSGAINMFATRVINGDILAMRFDENKKKYGPANTKVVYYLRSAVAERFAEVAENNYGATISSLLRAFMRHCADEGDFPFTAQLGQN